MSKNETRDFSDEIAIVGMAGRFPGAKDINAFWANLRDGVESIRTFSDEELIAAGVDRSQLDDPNYVKRGSFVDNAEEFDAPFFGFTPREAQITDPQHRLFLECAWEALENAGYDSNTYPGLIGVFAGCGVNHYLRLNFLSNPGLWNSVGDMLGIIGNDNNYLTTRASYLLNLTGPSLDIQTACSTSLVATQVGCLNLQNYLCDMALCGGVYLNFPRKSGYQYNEGEIFSPDGRCRAFDAEANGTVFGEGAGVVVLKRLEDALEDNDTIYAVIKGIAVNNDGALKIGLTAPSVQGQIKVISLAHALAGVRPETISYIETHGTGTPMGDPIEIAALTKSFRASTDQKQFCAVGSVKSNIGHLDAAAGVAGLIKTALSLKNRQIPPSLHCKTPNPKLDIENSPFFVNTVLSEWSSRGEPRRAGVSSLGVGGTNAHAILEEAPEEEPTGSGKEWLILPISAKTGSALDAATRNLAEHFRKTPNLNLADAAWTLQVGRRPFEHRRIVLCRDCADALDVLDKNESDQLWSGQTNAGGRPLVFMFSGQGAQYPNMGRGLYESEPVFRKEMARCANILLPALEMDIREVLYPDADGIEKAAELLQQTHITQPALFATEYALARTLLEWMPAPEAVIGHSLGEYVAACLAGVFSLEDALLLVAERGRLMEAQPAGAMTSVSLSADETLPLLDEGVEIATINAPTSCVVSGPFDRIEKFETLLSEKKIVFRRLRTSHAFHSAMMEPVVKPFEEKVRQIQRNAPTIPLLSNVTGTWITDKEAVDPAYWASHIRKAVRFSDGLRETFENPDLGFLEVGPGNTLCTFVRQHGKALSSRPVLFTLRHPQDDQPDTKILMTTVGKLWLAGTQIDWFAFHETEQRRRIPLPTYPFERKKHWIDPFRKKNPDPESHVPLQEREINTDTSIGGLQVINPEATSPAQRIEKALTAIWENLLGIDDIGAEDNFFDLGGHSLLAAQVISRIQAEMRVKIPVPTVFENPTIRRLAQVIEKTSSLGVAESEFERIPLVPKADKNALTSSQKRLWFIQKIEPDNISYNLVWGIRLSGKVREDVLRAALEAILSRHETLRTVFRSDEGKPYATVKTEGNLVMEALNVEELAPVPGNEALRQMVTREARKTMNMEQGPLFRVLLIRVSENDCLLATIIHHIIADGWSFGVFLRDLIQIYGALVEGRACALPELSCQYLDYAVWQQGRESSPNKEEHKRYWREKLRGPLPILEMPSDYPRPAEFRYEGALEPIHLSSTLTASLKTLSSDAGVTLFMTLLTVFKVLLARYSGQTDIIVGIPVANRNHVESENLIGCFLNVLAIRVDLSDNPSFQELLGRVQKAMMEAFAHSDLPFEEVIEVAQPVRDLNHHPLYQIMFAFQNFPMLEETAADVQFDLEFLDRGIAQYDLSLYMWEAGSEIMGVVEYSTELFEASTPRRMVGHFLELLQGVVANPSEKVGFLPFLTDEDRRLQRDWNATGRDFQRDARAVDLFELQARRTPEALAVSCGGKTVCYSELADRVLGFARYLRSVGVGPGTRVGIFLERSERMVEAILAIHKAGGAYVPLDPAFPRTRLDYILQDAGLDVVLAEKKLESDLPECGRARVIFMDGDWNREAPEIPPAKANGKDPAYVIYTSGSTGKPKGVVVPHSAITNFLESMRIEPGLSSKDVLLAVTTLSFDISVLELLLPLVSGAAVAIAERKSISDGKALADLLKETGATVMQATPVTWRILLEAGWQKANGLKALCGGEALSRDLANRILATGAELWNLYGPTETTVWSAACRVEPGQETPPIGFPIANTQFHVLDGKGIPLPIGIPGELWVGGEGLALGYLGKEEMTRERFVSETEGEIPEGTGRLYRTGDLVKRRADGKLDFLGRLDQQVKVRGFRIELEEIESELIAHPSVEQAAVAVREVAPGGDMRLVAYVVGKNAKAASLREHLTAGLPSYMVPSDFVRVEALPQTPNGKLDRKALPYIHSRQEREDTEYIAPHDDLEEQLTAIWESLLKVKPISTTADFFEIGGHSLLAAQLFAKMEKILGISLPLATLFRVSTLGGLAEEIRRTGRKPVWRILEPIQPHGDQPPLFLIHGGEGNVLLYRDLARHLGPNRPVYGVQSEGLFSDQEYHPRFETLASRYIQEIQSVQPEGPYYFGGYCMGGTITLEMALQLQNQGHKVGLVILLETYNIQELGRAANKLFSSWNRVLNLWFHFKNMQHLDPRNKWKFFLQKAQTEISRMKTGMNIGLSSLANRRCRGDKNSPHSPHLSVNQANEKAQTEYIPRKYAGRVLLFKPKTFFAGHEREYFGWHDILGESLKIETINIYPRGMLIEPYVEILAQKIAAALDDKTEK